MNHKSQTVAAVVVTCNNAETIERMLESVRWADEIVVVDRGSTDGTLEIVRRFTQRVFFHPSDDPAFLRQFAVEMTRCDWVLMLTPCEWVEEMLRHEIEGVLLATTPEVVGFSMPIKLYYEDQHLTHGGFYPERQCRLFRKGQARILGEAYDYAVDVPLEGLRELDRPLGAEPYRNLHDVLSGIDRQASVEAYRMVETGGSFGIKSHLLVATLAAKWSFCNRYVIQGGFLDGFHGLTMALARFMTSYMRHARFRALVE